MRLLYIENNLIDRKAFKRITRKVEGCECKIVSSLSEAKTILQANVIDVILSDLFLGDVTAIDVKKAYPNIPLIAVSGTHNPKIIRELEAVGVYNLLTKPISFEELQRAVLGAKTKQGETAKTSSKQPSKGALDLIYITELSEGDIEFELEMLGTYLEEVPQDIEKIQFFQAIGNWKEVGEIVHSLKAKISMVGLYELYETAERVEQHCRSNTELTNDTLTFLEEIKTELRNSLYLVQAEYDKREKQSL